MTANWRPRIRGSVLAFSDDTRIRFVDLGGLVVKDFAVERWVIALVEKLDGSVSVDELVAIFSSAVHYQEVLDCLQLLEDERILSHRSALQSVPDGPHARQLEYFDELLSRDPVIGMSAATMQKRVRDAHVVVIGCGGMGTHVLDALARSGVGTVEIFDHDLVELSNLNRQSLYERGDVGLRKVTAAARRLNGIDPDLLVHARPERFGPRSTTTVPQPDLVVNCGDEPDVLALSDIVAEWAAARGVPHIVGGAYGANLGVLPVSIVPGLTTCWECVRGGTAARAPGRGMRAIKGRGSTTGTLGPVTGVVSNFVALDAIRLLAGVPPLLVNAVRELDFATLDWRVLAVEPSPACSICGGEFSRALQNDVR